MAASTNGPADDRQGLGKLPDSDYLAFLGSFEPAFLVTLYSRSPPACLAIFSALPGATKHVLLRLLYIGEPLPLSLVAGWLASPERAEASPASLDDARLQALSVLHLWEATEAADGTNVALHPGFAANLQVAMNGGYVYRATTRRRAPPPCTTGASADARISTRVEKKTGRSRPSLAHPRLMRVLSQLMILARR